MATRRKADPAVEPDEVNVDLVLAEYNETYLTCRDLMHAWRIVGHFRTAGWGGSTKRLVQCQRCAMERYDQDDGVVVQHRYNQPDGYKIEGVRLSKREVRQEQLRRASNVWDSEDEMRKALKGKKPRTARSSNVVKLNRSA